MQPPPSVVPAAESSSAPGKLEQVLDASAARDDIASDLVASVADTPTVGELLRIAASEHPEREAYVHGDEARHLRLARPGRRRVRGHARRARRRARRRRVPHARLLDQVRRLLPRRARAGAITSAINLRLGATEQASILERTEPVVTVVGDGAEIPDGATAGTVLAVSELGTPPFARRAPTPSSPTIAATDPACIVWTSGTTGAPKGAVYDHAAHGGDLAQHRPAHRARRPAARRAAVPARRLHDPHVGRARERHDDRARRASRGRRPRRCASSATRASRWATGVPTQWELVLAHPDLARTDFSQLRVCGIGGAARSRPSSCAGCARSLGCPVITRYTSTEAGVTTSTLVGDPRRDRRDHRRPADARRRAAHRRRRRRRPSSAPSEVGEIWSPLAGDDARLLARPRAHRDRRRRRRLAAHRRPRDRRTTTATCASSAGSRRCTSAAATTCTRPRSRRCSPSIPPSRQVAVVGLPDPVLGEIGGAFVVPADAGSAADARRRCGTGAGSGSPTTRHPTGSIVVDELPVTAMHKIDKRALARRPTSSARRREEPERDGATTRRSRRPNIQDVGHRRHPGQADQARRRARSRWSSRTRATRSRTTAGTSATTSTRAADRRVELRAAARFVATRECKAKRYPADSPITPDPTSGSYLAVYWILAGKFGEWIQWGTNQVNWLHENDRMFPHRDHIHTLMYKYRGEVHADDDGVPAELALDRRYPGIVLVIGELAEGQDPDDRWVQSRPLPSRPRSRSRSRRSRCSATRPATCPATPPRTASATSTSSTTRPGDLGRAVRSARRRPGAVGRRHGRVRLAVPGTVPGTDRYTDQL